MENQMQTLLLWVGRVAGAGGVLIFAVAVAARLGGQSQILDFQTVTVLHASVAVMLVGCVSYLALIVRLLRKR